MFESLQFFQSAWPLRSEQPRETPIGENDSTSLASGAVVCLIIGVANAKNLFATSRARLAITAMDSHALVKCSDVLGEIRTGFGLQAVHPVLKRLTGGDEQLFPLIRLEFVCQRNGRQLRGMQNLI